MCIKFKQVLRLHHLNKTPASYLLVDHTRLVAEKAIGLFALANLAR